jgi:TRAP-type mannitol/chloroaromatic compound transport system substrate-binding protein
MDRRDFLKTTGAAAAALAAVSPAVATPAPDAVMRVAAPNIGSGIIDVAFASPWPETYAGYSDHARRLALRIEHASGDALRIAEFSVGATRSAADLAFGYDGDLTAAHPAFAVFSGLPGDLGLAAHDFEGWLSVAGGQFLWDDLAADFGVKPLAAGHSGPEPVLWSREPIQTASGLAGKDVFATGLAADLVRGLGATPATVTHADAFNAVRSGKLDVLEWGSLLHASADRIPETFKHGIVGGLTRMGRVQSLHVSRKLWDRLSQSCQIAISAAASAAYREAVAEARLHRDLVATALRERHGVVLRPCPPDLHRSVDHISSALVAHMAGFDARAGRINASYMAYRRAVSGRDPHDAGV